MPGVGESADLGVNEAKVERASFVRPRGSVAALGALTSTLTAAALSVWLTLMGDPAKSVSPSLRIKSNNVRYYHCNSTHDNFIITPVYLNVLSQLCPAPQPGLATYDP